MGDAKLVFFDGEDEIVLLEGDKYTLIEEAYKYERCMAGKSFKVVGDNGEILYVTGGIRDAPITES